MDMTVLQAATPIGLAKRECIEACLDCCGALRGFARGGARAGPGSPADRVMWRLMLDCAEICEATAAFLRTDSILVPQIAETCSRLCDDCATACNQADRGQIGRAVCADACRRCAQACSALRDLTVRPSRRPGLVDA